MRDYGEQAALCPFQSHRTVSESLWASRGLGTFGWHPEKAEREPLRVLALGGATRDCLLKMCGNLEGLVPTELNSKGQKATQVRED